MREFNPEAYAERLLAGKVTDEQLQKLSGEKAVIVLLTLRYADKLDAMLDDQDELLGLLFERASSFLGDECRQKPTTKQRPKQNRR